MYSIYITFRIIFLIVDNIHSLILLIRSNKGTCIKYIAFKNDFIRLKCVQIFSLLRMLLYSYIYSNRLYTLVNLLFAKW